MKRILLILSLCAAAICAAAQPKAGSFEQTWTKGPQWLENAVIYQVYPSSYMDSDGNGIGDIPGVLSKLDYIESLGVNVVWFNPLFSSGWIDGGYDILDYYSVDKRFGTNTDLVKLVEACHERGIKVFLDLVPGHTSMDHPWFRQSMQADANQQYSDYFIWSNELPDEKASKDLEKMLASENPFQDTRGKWMLASEVPGAERAKYYMKNFYACQPSLNFGFANPDPNHPWEQGVNDPGPLAVKQELKDILAFWFNKGVDGFRVDMANSIIKNDKDKSAIVAFWREIRSWMDASFPEHVLMAEWNNPQYCLAAGFNVDMYLNSTGSSNRRMYFDKKHQADGGVYFSLNGGQPSVKDLYGNPWPEGKVDRSMDAEAMLEKYYEAYGKADSTTHELGYYATITGNHDHLRLNTGARNSADQLKVMMAWVMTQQLPILYYGDEIGMRSLADLPNVEGANHNGKERAGARTPMQWDSSENAGFSTCEPENLYLPVCPEWTPATSWPLYKEWKAQGAKNPTSAGLITVESQQGVRGSLLEWTKALIALRKDTQAFWGSSSWEPVVTKGHPYPMVYLRSDGQQTYLVALNPTGRKQTVRIGALADKKALKVALQSGKASYRVDPKGDEISLGATSALIIRIQDRQPAQTPDLYAQAKLCTMQCGSLQREYYVYVPQTLSESKPLVFMLHGYGGKAYGYRPEMLESARKHGFALCIPVGYSEKGKYKAGWNVRYPSQKEMPTDDMEFILELKDKVVTDFGLNPDNCFLSGMSNGGDLAYAMALTHPEGFSAIASVAGLEFQWMNRELKAHGPVPFMEVHGTADKTSMWDGDPAGEGGWGAYLSVPRAVGNMASINGCEYEKTTVLPLKDARKPSRKVILHEYLGSPCGAQVRLYEVCGGKHSWHMADLDTTEEIWRFFEQYIK